jgi:hypothetical protein
MRFDGVISISQPTAKNARRVQNWRQQSNLCKGELTMRFIESVMDRQ